MRNLAQALRFRNSGFCMRYDTSSVKIRLSTCCVDGSGAADTNCTNDPPPPKHLPTCVWEVTEAGESRSRQRYAAGSRRKSAPFRRCVSFLQKTVCPSPVQREPETIFEYYVVRVPELRRMRPSTSHFKYTSTFYTQITTLSTDTTTPESVLEVVFPAQIYQTVYLPVLPPY